MRIQLLKINRVLLLFVLLTIVLYYGRLLLIPFTLAILLAMLMSPFCRRLDDRGWPRFFSSGACVFIVLLFFLLAIGILTAQFTSFIRDMSLIEQRVSELFVSLQDFIANRFDIPV